MGIPEVSRRQFLRIASAVSAASALAACGKKGRDRGKGAEPEVTLAHERFPTPEPIVEAGVTNAFGRELLSDAAPSEDQVLIESTHDPAHLDVARDRYEAQAALVWGAEPLLRLDKDWNPQPALAESFSAGPDSAYFDFVIRDGAKWSDGTPITADDFVFTYQHLSNPSLENPWVWYFFDIKGVKDRCQGKAGPEAIGVQARDARTVRIEGEGPVPHLPQMLAVSGTSPIPKHLAEKDPQHWADGAAGFLSSGPYALAKWEKGKKLEWRPNPHYNGPVQPAIEKVVQLLDEPENGWFWTWKERKIDLLRNLGHANVRASQTVAVISQQLHYTYDAHTEYLALNTLQAPLDNLKLRQALSHAIDRDTFCYDVMSYQRVPAYSMLPPNFPGYDETLNTIQSFDADRAKGLLAEAGYPEGKASDGQQLVLEIFLDRGREYMGSDQGDWQLSHRDSQAAEYVKQQWEERLGVSVKIVHLDSGEWNSKRKSRALQIYFGSYAFDYRDPANLLGALWRSIDDSGSLHHAWVNDAFDDLSREAGRTVDAAQRIAKYAEAERILVEDVGAVFLSHNYLYDMWWPHIAGIPFNEDGLQVYRPSRTPYQMYIRDDFAKWREQAGTTATGERHTPPTPVVEK